MILRPPLEQEKEVIELKGRIGGIPANKYGWSFRSNIPDRYIKRKGLMFERIAQKREADQVSIKDPLQEQKDRDLFRYVQSGRSGVPDVGFEGYHSEPGGLDV
jgi:hypothetical protein